VQWPRRLRSLPRLINLPVPPRNLPLHLLNPPLHLLNLLLRPRKPRRATHRQRWR